MRLQAWKKCSSRTLVSCLLVFLGRTIEWLLAFWVAAFECFAEAVGVSNRRGDGCFFGDML